MTTHDPATDHVELELGGMTCAACALHIEKQLNGLDGVSASVNFATERATIDYDAGVVDVVDLISRVESSGYTAVAPSTVAPSSGRPSQHRHPRGSSPA